MPPGDAGFKSISVDVIYGLPHQTLASMQTTMEQVLALNPDRLALYHYAHMPHLFKPQRRIDYEDLPSSAEKLDILQWAVEWLTQKGYVFIGMDHFAKPTDDWLWPWSKVAYSAIFKAIPPMPIVI